MFGIVANQPRQMTMAAAYLKSQGAKNIAVVIPNDAMGDSIASALPAQLDGAGIAHTEYRFPFDGVDLAPVLQSVVAARPDYIYMDGAGESVARLLDARVRAGGASIPTVAGSGIASDPLLQVGSRESLQNLYPIMSPTQAYIPEDERTDAFNTFFDAVGGDKKLDSPLTRYAYGWDTVQLWATAVAKAGSDDGDDVDDALESLTTDDSSPWVIWKKLFSKNSHWPSGSLDEFTYAEVTGVRDNMYETASS